MVSRRPNERGAALFIVVLVITLLTAIGIFSARSASLVDVATGYNRQSVQTQYLSEYGTKAVAAQLAQDPNGLSGQIKTSSDVCKANEKLMTLLANNNERAVTPCYKLFLKDVNDTMAKPLIEQAIQDPATYAHGSLGPMPLSVDFVAEMVDLGPAPPTPGFEQSGEAQAFSLERVTLITTGQIRPFSTSDSCTTAVTRSAGIQTMKAAVSYGPIR